MTKKYFLRPFKDLTVIISDIYVYLFVLSYTYNHKCLKGDRGFIMIENCVLCVVYILTWSAIHKIHVQNCHLAGNCDFLFFCVFWLKKQTQRACTVCQGIVYVIIREPPYITVYSPNSIPVVVHYNGGHLAKNRQKGPRYKTLCLETAGERLATNRSQTLEYEVNLSIHNI